MARERVREPKTKHLPWIGGVASVIWFSALGWYWWTHRQEIYDLTPNAMGDFLAGWFAPPAVFWLIIGYFLQQAELRHQIEELRHQVEATQDLAAMARLQAERDKARVQPLFTGLPGGSYRDTMTPKIRNWGAKALNVVIRDEAEKVVQEHPSFDTKEVIELKVTRGVVTWFTLEYDDAHGDRYELPCVFDGELLSVMERRLHGL